MRIAVVGTGYVGLMVGTGMAENGHTVVCVDRDAARVESLQQGRLPIHEPGLEELLVHNLEEERLNFTSDLDAAVEKALLVFICVGTPTTPSGDMDTSEVRAVVEAVARSMGGYRIIVIKSTCPVGTAEDLRDVVASITSHDFDIVANPEFLKEGAAVDDFMRPDRIVVGCEDVRVEEIMRELYTPFLRTGKPLLTMDLRSAEMTKFGVNAMIAARISLMNELAGMCEKFGADVSAVREGIAADSRIGAAYLFPGLGFGGSCLPKDIVAGARLAREKGLNADMLEAIATVNDRQVDQFIHRIMDYYGGSIGDKRLAIWGATFKPRTDDLRGAPALKIIDALLAAGAKVSVYDPVASDGLAARYGDRVDVAKKSYGALEGADGLIIATEWNEFRRPDFARMAELMREQVIFDGRNIYTPRSMAREGFTYFSVGQSG